MFDSKAAMTTATAAGFRFPHTALGEGYQWLRGRFPRKNKEIEGTAADPEAAVATPEKPATTNGQAAAVEAAVPTNGAPAPAPEPASEKAVANGGVGGQTAPLPLSTGGGDTEEAEEKKKAAAAAERARQAWDAVFVPGFEERYAEGGMEHEAGYDAFLTGCCFAAAATLGLGVGVEDLKSMASGGDTPEALGPVMNVVPLFRMVSDRAIDLYGYREVALFLAVVLCAFVYESVASRDIPRV